MSKVGGCGEGVRWKFDGRGTLKIEGRGQMQSYSRESAPWYYFRSQIKNIVIDEGITYIGSYAFADCVSVVDPILIPASVSAIGRKAFMGCTSMRGSLIVPDGVKRIEDYAFQDCISLTGVAISNSVLQIGKGAFCGCTNLQSISMPFVGSSRVSNQTTDAVFGFIFGRYDAKSRTEYTLVTQTYRESATQDYHIPTKLSTVLITDSKQIPYGAFSGCTHLSQIFIPANAAMDPHAFDNCTASVTTIPTASDDNVALDIPKARLENASLHFYMVYVDDGDSVSKEVVPAESIQAAKQYLLSSSEAGMDDIVAVKDVTHKYNISKDTLTDVLLHAKSLPYDEAQIILRTLDYIRFFNN